MTVSGGLVTLGARGALAGLSAALSRADAALYRAKAEGRNRILPAAEATPSGADGDARAPPPETWASYWAKFSANIAASFAAWAS